ncbi:MAG: SLBB domain-containing protein [Hahellaceae bacterium]|nr:SLBB domain-containing protein [Hahellaceae bacterium]
MKFITQALVNRLSLALALICLLFSVNTQALTPTPAQIEQFKRLPQAQQEAIARQYGIDKSALSGGGMSTPVSTLAVTDSVEARPPEKPSESEKSIEKSAAEAADSTTLADKKEEKVVRQKLEQFGYELFAGSPTTFAPVTDIPVSMDYAIGPGDTVQVQLYGKENTQLQLAVNREGQINFPNIGPLSVAGMTFAEMKEFLLDTIARQMIGVKASITLGELRSIRVFVLGEAYKPGSYTVSSLSTITNALFVSGGITKIGSLRKVQLKRKGEVIATLDLYDLLLKGDTRSDKRLLPGDVIFIPPIGTTAGISGEVKRPAIYELKDEKTVGDLVSLAGGYQATAYPQASRIERIDPKGNRTLVDVDLTQKKDLKIATHNGDVLQVFSVLEKMEDVVILEGHVHRPGGFAWKKGMRVSDMLTGFEDLLPNPDLNYGVIIRETQPDRRIQVLAFNPREAITQPKSAANIVLAPRDRLAIFAAEQAREPLLKNALLRLKSQVAYNEPPKVVSIQGAARFAGEYPLTPNATVKDLLQAAGGLELKADQQYALLVHRIYNEARISLKQLQLANDNDLQIALQPGDMLLTFDVDENREKALEPILSQLMRQASDKELVQIVNIDGSVRYPGVYPLTPRMTVHSLVEAAGGYAEKAYSLSAEITRTKIDENREKQFERLSLNLTEGADAAKQLVSRDQLFIKSIPNWSDKESITLSGEVRFPGIYPIYKGDTLYEVLQRAGGLTEFAYVPGAVFTREELRKQEAVRLQELRDRLAGDILKTELSMSQNATGDEKQVSSLQEVSQARGLLAQLDNTKALGRMVVDLERVLKGDEGYKIAVKDGDLLHVPQRNNAVTIIGEVQYSTSQHFIPGKGHKDYLKLSGGLTNKADDERVYIVKANGSVKLPSTGFLFFPGANETIEPGDTIVVPLDTDRVNQRILWRDVSQIFYQIALGAAAVGSL